MVPRTWLHGLNLALSSVTMTTYENAPATRLLATHCCVCGRPLLDSDSVEIGIGPTCRGKFAFDAEPNWDEVCTSLGLFAQHDPGDMQRLYLFEEAMAHLEDRGRVDTHKLSNLITHYIAAVGNRHDAHVGHLVDAITHMGRPSLADILRERLYTVRIVEVGNSYLVYTPYNEVFRTCVWQGRIGRWNKSEKAYDVPMSNKHALFHALKRAYPNTNALGPKGEFRL